MRTIAFILMGLLVIGGLVVATESLGNDQDNDGRPKVKVIHIGTKEPKQEPIFVNELTIDPQLGTTTVVDAACPADSEGTECKEATVTHPELTDATALLRISGEGSAGTILLTTGGAGRSLYRGAGQVTSDMMDELLDDGYRLVEVAWTTGHWNLPEESVFDVGSITLSSRFATLAFWAHDNLYDGGLFGAQGNSGGSAQIAFGLVYYDLESILDVANLGGGPPACPMEVGSKVNYGMQHYCNGGEDAEVLAFEPILSGNPDLHYPNTIVNFFIGENEPNVGDVIGTQNLYYGAISSVKSQQIVPNTEHPVHKTEEGTHALLSAIALAAL